MTKKAKDRWTFWLFLFPVLFAFVMTVIIPFIMGIFFTFTNWNGVTEFSKIDFVGFSNYAKIFSDKAFGYSLIITSVFTIFNVIVVNVIGFSLAFLVTRKIKTRNILRTGFFMPNLIGGLILGFIWQFIFNDAFVAFGEMIGSSFLSTPFLGERNLAIFAMIIVSAWQYGGYIMVIYVAALENVPEDLLEASKIDGANGWQTFKSIMVPMIMPAVTVCMFLTLSNSFKIFDLNLSLTNGGPGNSTKMLAMDIYGEAFKLNNFGVGQAKAIVFFIIVVGISLLQVSITKKKEVEV